MWESNPHEERIENGKGKIEKGKWKNRNLKLETRQLKTETSHSFIASKFNFRFSNFRGRRPLKARHEKGIPACGRQASLRPPCWQQASRTLRVGMTGSGRCALKANAKTSTALRKLRVNMPSPYVGHFAGTVAMLKSSHDPSLRSGEGARDDRLT